MVKSRVIWKKVLIDVSGIVLKADSIVMIYIDVCALTCKSLYENLHLPKSVAR
jgi:hypothetical protein